MKTYRLLAVMTLPTLLSLASMPATTYAASSTSSSSTKSPQFMKTSIELGGKNLSNPYGFSVNGTTYMPVWYVMQALEKMGIHNIWTNGVWELKTPSALQVNLSNIQASSGTTEICINGTVVLKVNDLVEKDPNSNQPTQYMPIWYVQQTLARLGINTTWDGNTWNIPAFPTADARATSNSAGSTQNLQFAAKQITLNGQKLSSPYSFVSGNTTYMPIWYVMQALQQLGVQNSWNNGNWNLTVPAQVKLDMTNINAGAGSTSISLNGTTVLRMDSISAIDPNSNQQTTYMPIWYVQQVLNRLGLNSTWDGTTWNIPPLPAPPPTPSSPANPGSSAGNLQFSQKQISVNGQKSSNPYSFVANGTTYMPIWYVMQALQQMGIQNTWNNNNWNLTVPAQVNVDLTNISPGTGSASISLNGTKVLFMDSISATDPNSNQLTTYMPIWYMQQALSRLGLNSTWDGSTWNIPALSSAGSTGGNQGNTGGNQGSSSSQPTQLSFKNVDLRYPAPGTITAASIDQFFANHPSPLTGLGQSFMYAQNTYGVDANYLVAQAILESAWGKSAIAQAKNNLFGYGAYDSNPGDDAGTFPTEDYAIRFQAWEIRNNYLTAGVSNYGGSPTLTGLGVHYATDPYYASSIASIMNQFASAEGDSVNSYQQYTPGQTAPQPSTTAEPVFYLNGAKAQIIGSPYYSGLPYYPSMGTGMSQMFFGPIQNGSIGSNVAILQSFLNRQINAGLTVDGDFGPMTQQALKTYQSQNGLQQTGVCDINLWNTILNASNYPSANMISPNTQVSVDMMMQGMAGGLVTEWYHIPGYGWVDGHYVAWSNVYRANVANPTSTQTTINVYNPGNPSQIIATLHSGDYVVCNNPTPQGGLITIQIADQLTDHHGITGVIQASQASLSQVPAPIQN